MKVVYGEIFNFYLHDAYIDGICGYGCDEVVPSTYEMLMAYIN